MKTSCIIEIAVYLRYTILTYSFSKETGQGRVHGANMDFFFGKPRTVKYIPGQLESGISFLNAKPSINQNGKAPDEIQEYIDKS